MKRLLLIIMVLAALQVSGLAQANHAKKAINPKTFLVDHSRPYVYLQVDHVGTGEPERDNEPKERIWLRLYNNCIVPIIVGTFGRDGILDHVVTNPDSSVGDGSASLVQWPSEMKSPPLPSIFGGAAFEPAPPKAQSSKSSQSAKGAVMPHGYMFPARSFAILEPGQSIYFSLPINQVSSKWHVEIPFRFDLKVKSPIRSASNFVALYEEDVAAKVATSRLH